MVLTRMPASLADPRSAYIWPPRDPDDLRPSIFSRNRSAAPGRGGARKAKYHPRQGQRHHVRRDSEGYLVRELTAEERTTMVESYVNTEDVEVYEMGPRDQESYVNPEDEYYDSGSAITDSGDEYSFTEDEENMRSAVNGYEYPPDGYTEEDAHWDQYVAADYAGRPDGMYDQHGDSYSIDSEEDDGDDTPLATLIPKTTISTKGRKKD